MNNPRGLSVKHRYNPPKVGDKIRITDYDVYADKNQISRLTRRDVHTITEVMPRVQNDEGDYGNYYWAYDIVIDFEEVDVLFGDYEITK